MVYITGDIHGEVRRVSEMIEKYEITPEDIIVILGDVEVYISLPQGQVFQVYHSV